ncbi:Alpha/Beta hydrolase protein [Bisporella sp. PMI_857]|nr:Alpha/Beta hydrolase protein [Bisporella sp. PMI_857]
MSESKLYYHITPSGSRIFVEESGSGPLMILMHGLGGTTNAFHPLVSYFSSKYTMLRFDFPGSGFSTYKNPPIIPQFVEDLGSILKTKGKAGETPILVGHSLGSIVAMHYASKQPGVDALVLIGAGRSAIHIPAAVERMSQLAEKAREGIEGIRDSTVANNVSPSSSDLVRTIVRQMISSQDGEGYAVTCEAICGPSHIDPDYSAIKCPVLLIAGDQDKISPLSRSQELKELIGGGQSKVEHVHTGHQHVLEDTKAVVKAMVSFFGT